MENKKTFYFIAVVIFAIVAIPLMANANGGVWRWPPNIHVSQTDQNAIIAWDGQEEILILSTNWQKSADSPEIRESCLSHLEYQGHHQLPEPSYLSSPFALRNYIK